MNGGEGRKGSRQYSWLERSMETFLGPCLPKVGREGIRWKEGGRRSQKRKREMGEGKRSGEGQEAYGQGTTKGANGGGDGDTSTNKRQTAQTETMTATETTTTTWIGKKHRADEMKADGDGNGDEAKHICIIWNLEATHSL